MPMGQMQKTIKLNVTVGEELWPYQVVDEIQKVMEEGLKKHPDGESWEKSYIFHVDRAIEHLNQISLYNLRPELFPDVVSVSLAHAFCRLMMALAIERGYLKEEDEFVKRDKKTEKIIQEE